MGFINQLVTGGPHIVGNIWKYDLNIIIHATYIGYIYIWQNYGIWNYSTIDMGNDMGYKYFFDMGIVSQQVMDFMDITLWTSNYGHHLWTSMIPRWTLS